MPTTIRPDSTDIKLWTNPEEVEPAAMAQLRNIAALPWVFHHVAVMPDVHLGKGATVGSVIAMRDAVAPAAVGVDIGCGMGAVRTNIRAGDPDNLEPLRSAIEARVPVGFNSHDPDVIRLSHHHLFDRFGALDRGVRDVEARARLQVGTLGGGNHFIEICLDQDDTVWIMLHSGSRNIGKTLAEIHMARAQRLVHNVGLPDRDLAVFLTGTPEMAAYMHDLTWAQEYALLNRQTMLMTVQKVMIEHFGKIRFLKQIMCHHNYVSREVHFGEEVLVTRKGAISAGTDELGIIPGSMGTRSHIVWGLGNPDSFRSASHGAGRRMGRKEARRRFTLADLEAQTRGVECRKDDGVLDEIPGAYKDIDRVMADQADLVEIVATLRAVLCVKG